MLVELSTEMRHLYLLLVSTNFIIGSTPPDLIVLILALFGLFHFGLCFVYILIDFTKGSSPFGV